jgi:hypothetical protein
MKLPENTHILDANPIPEGAFVVQQRSMVREKKLFEEAGREVPVFHVLLFFETNYQTLFNAPALESLGIVPQKFAAQCDQLLTENLGNNLKARIKAGAAQTPPVWPDQSVLDALYAAYDFSGIRGKAAVSEDDLTDEEIELRRQLRTTIRDYLRNGTLFAGMPKLRVQKIKEAETGELPAGVFPLAAFEDAVETAANGGVWSFDWTRYGITVKTKEGPATLGEYDMNWGSEPRWDDNGSPLNHSAIREVCVDAANALVATQRDKASRMQPAALEL